MGEVDIKVGCFKRFKLWFKNTTCLFTCSSCIVNKTKNNIDIDYNRDGVVDLSIPL